MNFVAALLLAFTAPAGQSETAEMVRAWAEICRTAFDRAARGDPTWIEREMDRLKLSEAGRSNQRTICMIYMEGRKDGRASS